MECRPATQLKSSVKREHVVDAVRERLLRVAGREEAGHRDERQAERRRHCSA